MAARHPRPVCFSRETATNKHHGAFPMHAYACMLHYLRKSDVPYLLKQKDESDVPKKLAARITPEVEEEQQ